MRIAPCCKRHDQLGSQVLPKRETKEDGAEMNEKMTLAIDEPFWMRPSWLAQ